MGAASSTRTMTMKNNEPHIIQITNDVKNRLLAGLSPEVVSTSSSPSQQIGESYNERMSSREKTVLSSGPTGAPFLETVSALQVRSEKDEELRANDTLWRSKLKELEQRYVTSAFASEEEFNTELETLGKMVPKKREAICADISPRISECYLANPKQTLKCATLVQQFAKCVENNYLRA